MRGKRKDSIKIFPKLSRAQASIIVIILLIVLTLVAFVVFWNVYYYFVKSRVSDISVNSLMVGGEIEYYLPSEFAVVQVKRKNDEVNVSGLKIMFTEKITKNSYIYETTNVPKALETKMYVIFKGNLKPVPSDGTWNFGRVESISLHYMFPNGKVSDEMDKKVVTPENMSTEFRKKKCLYTDSDHDGYGTGSCVPSTATMQAGMSPLDGDCNDANADINPGAVEITNGKDDNCDGDIDDGDGEPGGGPTNPISNYLVTNASLNSYSSSDGGCIYTSLSEGQVVSFPVAWDFYFYNESVKNVTICSKGHLIIGGSSADCFTTGTPTVDFLKSKKTIAPLVYSSTSTPQYCNGSGGNFVVFKWNYGPLISKAIIYSNGKILFSYSSSSYIFEGGISHGDSTYYSENHRYNNGDNSNDCEFRK